MARFHGRLFLSALAFTAATFGFATIGGSASTAVHPLGSFARSTVKPATGGTVVYNTIQEFTTKGGGTAISSYIPSLGFECCTVSEFGDAINLSQAGGTLKDITVVFDSWGCEQGSGTDGSCVTTPGAKFNVPMWVSVYGPPAPSMSPGEAPGLLLVRIPFPNVKIPYRPSWNHRCDDPPPSGYPPSYGTYGGFIDTVTKECVYGKAEKVKFNMSVPRTRLPGTIVVTVAYSTTTYGPCFQSGSGPCSPGPVGTGAACFTAGPSGSDQCGYDSLNVSAYGPPNELPSSDPVGSAAPMVGTVWDPYGTFVDYAYDYFDCGGTYAGYLALDAPNTSSPSGCWYGYHPEIQVTTF